MNRIPPQAPDVERHVIGAMLLDAEAVATGLSVLTEADLYLEPHRVLFEAVAELSGRNQTVDMLTVKDTLNRAGRWSEDFNRVMLDISAEVVSSANVAEHCGIVREKSMLRRLIASSTRLLEDAYTGERSALEIADAATEEIGALLTGQADQGPRHIRRCFEEAARGWEQVMAGKVEGGVPTGLQDLDRILFSLRPGKHVVIAARPGFGKSALALQIAARAGVPSCLYSLEMLATEEVERVLAQHCGVDSTTFADAARLRAEWEKIQEAMREMQDLPIWISDDSTVTPARITAQARAMKRRRGLGLLVVDYLQLVATAYQKGITREREVAMISSSLKRLSMQVQIPVLSVASLSRECEKRENKRPVLADLRESGNIESDADTVIFLYRHSEYDREMPKSLKDIVEIDVRKNRGGKKGVALARFEDHAVRFHGLNEREKEEYRLYIKGIAWESPDKKQKYAASGRDKAAGE